MSGANGEKGREWKWTFVAGIVFVVLSVVVFFRVIPSATAVLNISCDQKIIVEKSGPMPNKCGSVVFKQAEDSGKNVKGNRLVVVDKKTEETTCWPKIAALLVSVFGGVGLLGGVAYVIGGFLRALEY